MIKKLKQKSLKEMQQYNLKHKEEPDFYCCECKSLKSGFDGESWFGCEDCGYELCVIHKKEVKKCPKCGSINIYFEEE